MLMQTGQGLAIEKNLSKYGVKVLAAETRKQVSFDQVYAAFTVKYCCYFAFPSRKKKRFIIIYFFNHKSWSDPGKARKSVGARSERPMDIFQTRSDAERSL